VSTLLFLVLMCGPAKLTAQLDHHCLLSDCRGVAVHKVGPVELEQGTDVCPNSGGKRIILPHSKVERRRRGRSFQVWLILSGLGFTLA
jgi:hypothetical protein